MTCARCKVQVSRTDPGVTTQLTLTHGVRYGHRPMTPRMQVYCATCSAANERVEAARNKASYQRMRSH